MCKKNPSPESAIMQAERKVNSGCLPRLPYELQCAGSVLPGSVFNLANCGVFPSEDLINLTVCSTKRELVNSSNALVLRQSYVSLAV